MSAAGCIGFGLLWQNAQQRLDKLKRELHRPDGVPFEQLAFQTKARDENASLATVERLATAISMRFPDRHCVELRLRWGVAGGSTIYCFFQPSTRRLVQQVQIGE
jgi:hypothetical protein